MAPGSNATRRSHCTDSAGRSPSRASLGQYLLEEKIGGGGLGEVWRARHRLLIRPAAIKLISQQVLARWRAIPELVRRFEREARATAALTAPHTVQLYDFGVAEK